MKYDVTIGIPVYNADPYIRKTIESALSQTYPSIEFLIVDDGSIDHSIDIIKAIFTIIINKFNNTTIYLKVKC